MIKKLKGGIDYYFYAARISVTEEVNVNAWWIKGDRELFEFG